MDGSVRTVTNEEPVKSTEDIGITDSYQQEKDQPDTDISNTVTSKPRRVKEDYSVVWETANNNYQQKNTTDITGTAASLANIRNKTVKAKGRMDCGDGNDSSMEAGGDGSQDYLLPQGKEYWYCYHCY